MEQLGIISIYNSISISCIAMNQMLNAVVLFHDVEGIARVAELVDALVLGTSALCMGVRVPPLAPDVIQCSSVQVTSK